ncbi:DUF3667 domain-containing protein [Tenacibaculum maritimum]|nr:DUF3667 domain-containing protein [Tenacibaculum maritimum]MDB0612133.1 DUF3667 domain-containing protein [Tenacibaculum maritimum]
MIGNKKDAIVKDVSCLNCGYPFSGQENFCPECGQKNKGLKLTFSNFIKEVFKGFITWDSKFWNTIIPLLIKPGKISKDYIEGKRIRYANPFRFYFTVSIIFFLTIGITDNYIKFNNFRKGTSSSSKKTILANNILEPEEQITLDSIQKALSIAIDSANNKITKKTLRKTDSLEHKAVSDFEVLFKENRNILPFLKFQKENPNLSIDEALDSLGLKKTFQNRFWYSRSSVINSFMSDKESEDKYKKQMISYSSVALFVLLPLFTLFLRIIYFRKRITYVEHLVFVFHIQTVFFLLFTVFYIINVAKNTNQFILVSLIIFMTYLFIAMKKFYNQSYLKTFVKYVLANIFFVILASLGTTIISVIAFALY